MRGIWNLAKTSFGFVLEYYRREAIGIWLGQVLKLCWNFCDERQMDIGQDKS